MRLRWTVSAVEDLEHIRDYLDSHKPQLTRSTVLSIYEDIRSLKIHPYRGRYGLREGTRELTFHPLPYVAVYRIRNDAVEILHIYHGAQNRS